MAGVPGGIFATIGVIFPSLIIISIIAAFLTNFAHLSVVIHAFNGIRACVGMLILNAVYNMAKKSVVDFPSAIIFAGVTFVAVMNVLSPFLLVMTAGALGVIIQLIKARKQVK